MTKPTIDSRPKTMAEWMRNERAPPQGPLKLGKSYNFVDKVEIIDVLRTAIEDNHLTITALSNKSGVAPKTISRWFDGKTKRPQVPTLNAVGKLVGLKLNWVKE
jgi:hypothetical protein